MNFLSETLDFLSPRFCVSCKCKLSINDKFICPKCYSEISKLSNDEIKNELQRKFVSTNYIDDYTSLFNFEEHGPLQALIHNLKYNRKFKIGYFLGLLLATSRERVIKNWKADLILPIPLFHLKKIERGYNQSDYIAKGLSKESHINYNTSICKRIKNTTSQTKLNSSQRRKNMENAFQVKKHKIIKNKNIIVVDDVITTGTTVLELAKVLKENGASKVFSISIATPLISHAVGS